MIKIKMNKHINMTHIKERIKYVRNTMNTQHVRAIGTYPGELYTNNYNPVDT